MKIQQKTEFESTKPKIAKELGSMYRENGLDCLQLGDDEVTDQKIDAISIIDG